MHPCLDVKGVMHSEHTKIMRGGTGDHECDVTVVYIPQHQKEGYCWESACMMLDWTTELISLKVTSWIVQLIQATLDWKLDHASLHIPMYMQNDHGF